MCLVGAMKLVYQEKKKQNQNNVEQSPLKGTKTYLMVSLWKHPTSIELFRPFGSTK